METRKLSPDLSVVGQIQPDDVGNIAAAGYKSIICSSPDGEEASQPAWATVAHAAKAAGLSARYIPVGGDHSIKDQRSAFATALAEMPAPILAYCKTGNRCVDLFAAVQADAGAKGMKNARHHHILIAGGGSAGIATAASILQRSAGVDIALIEPKTEHYYQPGWTMVGGGIFDKKDTCRSEASVMPDGVTWIEAAVTRFDPESKSVELNDGSRITYDLLVVAMGNRLAWDEIEGLEATLGRNNVTSNYRYDLAPYTWELVKQTRSGRALFTQPPMPIKCAGAPQKAMYLSCSEWEKQGLLNKLDIEFHNAGGAIFGVEEYIPALMETVERYGIDLAFGSNLVRVDGPNRKAWFATADGEVERDFDMLHVCPPQKGNAIVAKSPLADDAGYAEVDQHTLRHMRYPDVFALGDCCSTPNAKTMAAARKQAPVVAENALAVLKGKQPEANYDGYGSCPLTVENGKIVLAEFLYGGKVAPSFPKWLINGSRPSRLAWQLKTQALPWIYWHGMLKGREWLAKPASRF
jgi:sulfide:quinone oxidoreductase|tara:strand:- start:31783 stop:33351 length:1569 start_codon:yes stop_codon:yes gene_type:complete